MKYCAHIQLQHYGASRVLKVDSIREAREAFDNALHESRGWRDDEACSLTIYNASEDGVWCECNSAMNFHQYPLSMHTLGPRGGIRRECV